MCRTRMLTSSDEGYKAALRWLARRSLTRAEVTQRLQRAGVADVDAVLDRLVQNRWLSDQAVADSEAHEAARRRLGPARLAARLRHRGVDAAVAREVLEALSPAEVEERARQAVKGVISKEGVPRDPRTRERLVRRLLRLGFSGPVVAKVLAGMPEASSADEGGTEW